MSGWSDADVLRVIWRVGALGQSATQVCLAFDATRSAVLGLVKRVRDAGPQVEAARLGDADRYFILDAVLAGRSAQAVGKPFGLSRYAVLHLVSQILRETAESGTDLTIAEGWSEVGKRIWPAWWSPIEGRIAA